MEIMELDIKFRELHRLHRRAMEMRLNKTGVYRAQHQILMCLSDHPQSSQIQIAERFKISSSAVATSLKKLEKGGYLERVVDMEDNRFHKVSLTEKGRQVVENSHEIFQQTIREIYQNLSASDMEQMMSFYEKLEENLKRICQEEQEK